MASEPLAAELARVAAWAAAAFAGLSASAGLGSLLRRGDGGAKGRSIVAMVAGSAAVAAAGYLFVASARLGSPPSAVAAYAGAGLALGLAAGLFPRAFGLSALAVALSAAVAATAAFGPWLPWAEGGEAARLAAYSSTADGTLCALRIAGQGGRSEERNVSLPPGAIVLEFDAVETSGPLSIALGKRRYRLAAVEAGGARVAVAASGGVFASRAWLSVAGLLGCRTMTILSPPFEPEPLAAALFTMRTDGRIEILSR